MEEGHEQGLIEKIVSKTKKLGWNKPKVSLEVDQSADVKSKLMLIGKILSLKLSLVRLSKILLQSPGIRLMK